MAALKVIPVEDLQAPWMGDNDWTTWWSDHGIARIKNLCTGKCLIFDDGFWGRLHPQFKSIFDPCELGRPPMVICDLGMVERNKLLSECGCSEKHLPLMTVKFPIRYPDGTCHDPEGNLSNGPGPKWLI